MVKHNLDSVNDVTVELALEVFRLKIENATLSTLLVKNGSIKADEYKMVYDELTESGRASYIAKLLKITKEEAEEFLFKDSND